MTMEMRLEDLPEPFLGRLVIETIIEDVTAYKRELYGMAPDSKIQLVETENEHVPYKKGKVVKLATDSFGERYQKYYGTDRPKDSFPQVGDIVLFVPNQNFKLDPAGKYSLINDEHIVAFYKGK